MSVMKCVNYIRSRGLQHRQFCAFFEGIESKYSDLLYFTEVRWLSRDSTLKRFFELKTEVKRFMEGIKMLVPQFEDHKWMTNLAFLVDVTHELNILNLKLQGPGQLVPVYDNVTAFTTKLKFWKNQIFFRGISLISQHASHSRKSSALKYSSVVLNRLLSLTCFCNNLMSGLQISESTKKASICLLIHFLLMWKQHHVIYKWNSLICSATHL
ncbi:GTF2I repeat domain containing 2B [Chelydra serpentina]|uniref:GTF2I repeat domain containing 2B n=1 Tax=Chelydra serpentina TaxID=8475 RepID=A0A8T1SPF0_CHESE|nr:GTF2I repeat domain containing 2B [Chelydra serpentina]